MLTSVQLLLDFSLTTFKAFSAGSGDEGTTWYGLPDGDILTLGQKEEVEGTEKHASPRPNSSFLLNSPIPCDTLRVSQEGTALHAPPKQRLLRNCRRRYDHAVVSVCPSFGPSSEDYETR
ncbi:hypothetical protein PTI98_000672 [Pleurotus ostreatus]|nr:hypothetical protein PTI98_000672 [Pleurotus ostreatus]